MNDINPWVLLSGGLVYAVVFWAVCFRRPHWALAFIVASSPFQNDMSGGGPLKFSLAEVNLFLSLPIVFFNSGRWRFGPTLIPALIYLGVCLLSALIHWRPTALISIIQTALYLIVVVMVFASLARGIDDYRLGFYAFLSVCALFASIVCVLRVPSILGLNKNGLGASLATAFLIGLELWHGATRPRLRRWLLWTSALVAAGCLFSLSRGAWLSAIAGTLVIFGLRQQFKLMLRTALLMVPVLVFCWFLLPVASREYATGFDADRWNIKMRYQSADYAWEQFKSNPWIGVGVGLRKEYDATNVGLSSLAETGVPGLLAFLALHATVFWMCWRACRVTPRQSFAFSILALAFALSFAKLLHGMVDHYWSRGPLTVAWATIGMAVYVIHLQRVARLRALIAHQDSGLFLGSATHGNGSSSEAT